MVLYTHQFRPLGKGGVDLTVRNEMLERVWCPENLFGDSWVVISRVISRITMVITYIMGLTPHL